MYNFIHKLPTPTGIVSFEGEIIDVNDWMVKDSRAHSKLQIMNYSMFELMVDNAKHYELVDLLRKKKFIQNQKILLKTFDGNIGERTCNLSILSEDNNLILYQIFGSFDTQPPTVDHTGQLLKDFRKLYPYLNKVGKEVFNQVVEMNERIINKSTLQVQVEFISKKIGLSFPKLTQSEKYLSSLIAMGLTAKEIAQSSGFSRNTIRVNIHRICHKQEIANRDELFCVLKQAFTNSYCYSF